VQFLSCSRPISINNEFLTGGLLENFTTGRLYIKLQISIYRTQYPYPGKKSLVCPEGNGSSARQSIYSVIAVLDLSFIVAQAFSQAFSKKA
jgi:hypothetical protein